MYVNCLYRVMLLLYISPEHLGAPAMTWRARWREILNPTQWPFLIGQYFKASKHHLWFYHYLYTTGYPFFESVSKTSGSE